MGFIALVFALLIEQGRPLPPGNRVHRLFIALADMVRRGTDAGERQHGLIGWLLVAGGVCGGALALHWASAWLHPIAGFCVHVAVLYLTVGFRQFSHPFTEVQLALAAGDLPAARRTLAAWVRPEGEPGQFAEASQAEICRGAIAHALVESHRHVFGPLLWYVLLPGVVGPALYRIAELLGRRWGADGEPYGVWARRAFGWIDWIPLRLSAAGFAVVGNFEDAVYAWRGGAAAGRDDDGRSLLLAAGGGALGLRLADPALEASWAAQSGGEEPLGVEPGPEGLRSAVGLVWRSVVLWIALFAMLSAASWLGR
jgi:adenosylcobinamide-phosphate synthase